MVECGSFGSYRAFRIVSGELELRVCELGASLLSMKFAGQECVIGYDTPEGYEQGKNFIGMIAGRYANRIARGEVKIDGTSYQLDRNDGNNHLHGGYPGFHRCHWAGEVVGESAVRFTLHSPAGEAGYPGNVTATVTYRIENGAVRLDLTGETDAPTVFAPTTHSYFNLSGKENALDAALCIHAERRLPVDGELIPTGELAAVEGRYDFRTLRPIRGWYDDAFLLDGTHACTVQDNGMEMQIHTDYPALQLYTGEGLTPPHHPGEGFALEPELCPDSPHHPDWAQPLLRPGKQWHKYIEYHFRKI